MVDFYKVKFLNAFRLLGLEIKLTKWLFSEKMSGFFYLGSVKL